ncbi:hypothetical protein BSKO_14148 [Bryopsis sp. KO-2023]|nr:hypothetical protein BSKO_14148 [Bryopsis sp. KO-2023]
MTTAESLQAHAIAGVASLETTVFRITKNMLTAGEDVILSMQPMDKFENSNPSGVSGPGSIGIDFFFIDIPGEVQYRVADSSKEYDDLSSTYQIRFALQLEGIYSVRIRLMQTGEERSLMNYLTISPAHVAADKTHISGSSTLEISAPSRFYIHGHDKYGNKVTIPDGLMRALDPPKLEPASLSSSIDISEGTNGDVILDVIMDDPGVYDLVVSIFGVPIMNSPKRLTVALGEQKVDPSKTQVSGDALEREARYGQIPQRPTFGCPMEALSFMGNLYSMHTPTFGLAIAFYP